MLLVLLLAYLSAFILDSLERGLCGLPMGKTSLFFFFHKFSSPTTQLVQRRKKKKNFLSDKIWQISFFFAFNYTEKIFTRTLRYIHILGEIHRKKRCIWAHRNGHTDTDTDTETDKKTHKYRRRQWGYTNNTNCCTPFFSQPITNNYSFHS